MAEEGWSRRFDDPARPKARIGSRRNARRPAHARSFAGGSSWLVTASRTLDFIGKTVEVFAQTIEYFALCLIRSQVADKGGLCRIRAELFDSRLIILHDATPAVAGRAS
jgi:hypothetical protein